MRYLLYAKTGAAAEELFYDSELGDPTWAVANPILKLELNKAGTLNFTILPTHPMYGSFQRMITYVRVTLDDEEIFRGRVLEIQDSMYKERAIQCEGDIAYLVDSLQPPQQTKDANTTTKTTKTNATPKATYGDHVRAKSINVQTMTIGATVNVSSALSAQFSKYINQHNSMVENEKKFTVGNITVTSKSSNYSFSSSGYRDTMNAIDSDLLNQHGGYLMTRKNPNGPTYIDWLENPGPVAQQHIVLGVNLIDLQQQMTADELFTIFVPIGDDDLTIASVNDGKIGIESATGIARYGKIYKTENYSGIKDASELKKLGEAYMDANYKPDKVTLSLKAVDMHMLDGTVEAIHVGYKVNVVSEPHGIDMSLYCISIEYDIQNPENNSYEIGDPSETLSQKTNAERNEAASATRSAASSAAKANASADTLEDTINQHAANIMFEADELFRIDADLVQVHAKCINIDAQETVTVTCDDLEVNASGKINMQAGGTFTVKAGGDIKMESGTVINFNDTVYLGNKNLPSKGSHLTDSVSMIAYDVYFHQLEIGSHLYISDIEDENGAKWSTQSLTDFLSMYSASFIYTGGTSGADNLEDSVKGFGQGSVDGSGIVSIPYYTFSGYGEGNITFDMAATQFFIDSMAAEYDRGYDDGYSAGQSSVQYNTWGYDTLYYYDDASANYYMCGNGNYNWYYN